MTGVLLRIPNAATESVFQDGSELDFYTCRSMFPNQTPCANIVER
jgi:hypothetical protein